MWYGRISPASSELLPVYCNENLDINPYHRRDTAGTYESGYNDTARYRYVYTRTPGSVGDMNMNIALIEEN